MVSLIPIDVLASHLFPYFTLAEAAVASCVCKIWNRVFKSETFWKSFCVRAHLVKPSSCHMTYKHFYFCKHGQKEINEKKEKFKHISFFKDQFLTVSAQGKIQSWDQQFNKKIEHQAKANLQSIDSFDEYIFLNYGERFDILKSSTMETLRSFKGWNYAAYDNRLIVHSSYTLNMWDLSSLECEDTFALPNENYLVTGLYLDEQRITCLLDTNELFEWNFDSKKWNDVEYYPNRKEVVSSEFTNSHLIFYTKDRMGFLDLVQLTSPIMVDFQERKRCLFFSNQRVYLGSTEGTIMVLDHQLTLIRTLKKAKSISNILEYNGWMIVSHGGSTTLWNSRFEEVAAFSFDESIKSLSCLDNKLFLLLVNGKLIVQTIPSELQ